MRKQLSKAFSLKFTGPKKKGLSGIPEDKAAKSKQVSKDSKKLSIEPESPEIVLPESTYEKAFRLQDYYDYTVAAEERKEKKLNVNKDPNGKAEYKMLSYLFLPSNVANILKVRQSIDDLVTKHKWDWKDALELLLDDATAKKVIELKSSYALETDELKYNRAFTQLIKDISELEYPLEEQRNYLCHVKRKYVTDSHGDLLEAEKFYNLMAEVNELLPWIDPNVTNDNKLSDEDLWSAFLQSVKSEWIDEATAQGLDKDKKKLFEYVDYQTKYEDLNTSFQNCHLLG